MNAPVKNLVALSLGASMVVAPLTPALAQVKHRHTKLKTIAAGVAAYEVAKHTGKNRVTHGRRKNFLQRHPVLTGIGAAALMHHHLKKKH